MQSYNYLFQNYFYSHFSCHRGKNIPTRKFLFIFRSKNGLYTSSLLFGILEKITQIIEYSNDPNKRLICLKYKTHGSGLWLICAFYPVFEQRLKHRHWYVSGIQMVSA